MTLKYYIELEGKVSVVTVCFLFVLCDILTKDLVLCLFVFFVCHHSVSDFPNTRSLSLPTDP